LTFRASYFINICHTEFFCSCIYE